MIQRDVEVEMLNMDMREVWLTMGIQEGNPDSMISALIEEVQQELFRIARPKYCYAFTDEVSFNYGSVIAKGLSNAERYAIVVSTAGEEVDAFIHKYKTEDITRAFVADSLASEMVEATSRAAIEDISNSLKDGEKISNPYSPGYCGWLLKEQSKLFSYLPDMPCGIRLNDSFLMLPIKSISSVLAIGRDVGKAPYGCAICDNIDCYKKR